MYAGDMLSVLVVRLGCTVAVEVVIDCAAMSMLEASVIDTLRVDKLAVLVAEGVVSPVARIMVQAVSAGRVAPPTKNTNCAVASPELLTAAVKVLVSHPLLVTVGADAPPKPGSTRVTLSPCSTMALFLNAYDTAEGDDVTGNATVKTLVVSTGPERAVEVAIDVDGIFALLASVMTTLRVDRFASWPEVVPGFESLLVEATMIVHAVCPAILEVEVNSIAALAVP
jgi:hypothetical protein